MRGFTTVAALAALASSSYAATVTIKETPCLQDYPLEEYTIETDKLVVQEFNTVCGFRIVSSSPSSILNSITCQAYKDTQGNVAGSARFTYAHPAMIATNPVQERSILCSTTPGENDDASEDRGATTISTKTETVVIRPTGGSPTGGPGGNGGNSTQPSRTLTPSATAPSGTGLPTGGAGMVGWSVGAAAVAVAGLLV